MKDGTNLQSRNDCITNASRNDKVKTTEKLFNKSVYSCPMAILNACIRDLTHRKFDIKKIAIFEEPPQAILHIKEKSSTEPPKSWLRKFRSAKETHSVMTCVKLYVTQNLDSKASFHLNYEILHSEAL